MIGEEESSQDKLLCERFEEFKTSIFIEEIEKLKNKEE